MFILSLIKMGSRYETWVNNDVPMTDEGQSSSYISAPLSKDNFGLNQPQKREKTFDRWKNFDQIDVSSNINDIVVIITDGNFEAQNKAIIFFAIRWQVQVFLQFLAKRSKAKEITTHWAYPWKLKGPFKRMTFFSSTSG